jgi:tetratricopeptide (TPR) repeat protein
MIDVRHAMSDGRRAVSDARYRESAQGLSILGQRIALLFGVFGDSGTEPVPARNGHNSHRLRPNARLCVPHKPDTHSRHLGGLYTEMRRYRETGDQYRRSLNILKQMSPAPNARIVRTLYWLGQNYLQQGEKASAENVFARAVEIVQRNPVPDAETPMLLDAYADILKSVGKLQEALHAEAKRARAAMALTVRVPNPN